MLGTVDHKWREKLNEESVQEAANLLFSLFLVDEYKGHIKVTQNFDWWNSFSIYLNSHTRPLAEVNPKVFMKKA